ncbi:MAG TPA: hypothetical protein VNW72_01835 [Chthoniobacterales bacterium]|jgi:hypothetical protein|nr:hypothetical protein [Chthoniobacterales bacterium]
MKSRLRSALFLVSLTVARFAFPYQEFRDQPPSDVVVEHRDLKLYADGGEFKNDLQTHYDIRHIDELRQFIWRHWNERTRARARLSITAKDSQTETYFFVEPDKNGAWRVALRGLDISYPCPTCNRWFLRDTIYADSVEWQNGRGEKKLVLKRNGKKVLELSRRLES